MKSEIILTAAIWFFVLIFFILACVKCRRVRIVPSFVIVLSFTFFTLLAPAGEVLLSLGSFKITLDSLLLGLRRSGILVGMVFLSRLIISQKSGKAFMSHGGIISNKLTVVLFYLDLLT
jgi:heptaprenyl diphosphate synthase